MQLVIRKTTGHVAPLIGCAVIGSFEFFKQYSNLYVKLIIKTKPVVRVIFSHTGGYGNTGSKGSQSSSSSQSHILTYRGLWKYG